jgi:glycosyltransferase involved in cell wall biosynthesis
MATNYWNIKFLGERTQPEVIEILKQTDIFVNPSYSEGLPTSVLEAASLGLPIIATDVGGTREIIEHMKSGYLIKPGIDDLYIALGFLLRQRAKGNEMGRQAKLTAKQKFNWDTIVKQYEKVFDRLDRSVLKYME